MTDKKFGFIPIASDITPIPPNEIAQDDQTELFHLGGEHLNEDNVLENIPIIFFILTGGTEQKAYNIWKKRKEKIGNEPVFILAHPGNNSLPAALEILARLHREYAKGKIIYLDSQTNKECWNDLERIIKYYNIFYRLKRTKIGLIGNPSDWLIASMPENEIVKNVWGPQVVPIDLNELKNEIQKVTDVEIEETHYSLVNNAEYIKEPSKKELKSVVKVYAALKHLIKKYELNAVSVRCFDLVTDLKTTGCFALAKLNDEGITAGCEGDIVSTVGMLWANLLTDQTVWMANPAQLDEQSNSVLLAHCTVPLGMVDKYKLRSHFESGLGVGIEGELSKGKATLFRLGGKNLDKAWISNVEIMESSSEENLCRTQVRIKLHSNMKPSDLLSAPLGNHMLLLRGSYAKEMHNWMEIFINHNYTIS